jgi:hypothetical protein
VANVDALTQSSFESVDKMSPEEISRFKGASRLRGIGCQRTELTAFEKASAVPHIRIIAEGDSWFDYPPGTNLIDHLRNLSDYGIEHFAKADNTLENMVYGMRITRDLQRDAPQIQRILKRIGEVKPGVFLFSEGGNDIACDEFALYLNHELSGLPAFLQKYARQVIHSIFNKYFEDLISSVAEACLETRIVVHGYRRTLPTGKSVNLFVFTLSGPWLLPALVQKAILYVADQQSIVSALIDQFNDVLADLAETNPRFHHVNLPPILPPRSDWVNELHLTNRAYDRAAREIHSMIEALYVPDLPTPGQPP